MSKKVKVLEGPKKSTRPGKDKMVVVEVDGKKKTIHYGDSSMKHNYSKKANENFRARHRCDTDPPEKDTARYWSCENLWKKWK
jgi:hypothetical protein